MALKCVKKAQTDIMKNTVVIGVAGGSGSGKSTFADLLQKHLTNVNGLKMSMDSYYKAEEQLPRAPAPITSKEYADYNHPTSIDMPKLKKELNERIACGKYDVIILNGSNPSEKALEMVSLYINGFFES